MTEQPLPKPGGRPVTPEVRRLLDEREAKGIETYGRSLETFNGRSFLRDATEEALDLTQYLVGLRMELETIYSHLEWAAEDDDVQRRVRKALAMLRVILGKAE